MNNLKNMRTYLIGAMDRVNDHGIKWREAITPYLQNLSIEVLNPCIGPIKNIIEDDTTRYWIDYYKETGQYNKIRNLYGHIRNSDLRCVDISDFVIAHIDIGIHACGSYEEIVTANRQKKPTLIWCEQGKRYAPNWLFFMLPHEHIFSSMIELIDYLNYVNNTKEISKLNRWFFINNRK